MTVRKSVKTEPKVVEPTAVSEPVRFGIDDLCKSDEFTRNEKDFLKAIVVDKQYTVAEAKKLLSQTLKGAVK
ncbi:hypothetical protein [Bavariicoccus seileri]|uniref:hypothetical protein n=1 Tax=Bavariicoccus seileri TaxID=549685 RepID=UPI0003B3CE9A|nr:hypothetical protein [Bavariicoccus seileri]